MNPHDLQEHHGSQQESTAHPYSDDDSPATRANHEQRVQAIMGFLSTWGAMETQGNRGNATATPLDHHGRTLAEGVEQECAHHATQGITKGADVETKVRIDWRKADVQQLLDSAAENLALERREAYHNGHEVGWHAGRNVGFRLGFACASMFAITGAVIGWWVL